MAQSTDYPGSAPRPALPVVASRRWTLSGARWLLYYAVPLALVAASVGLKSIDRLGLDEAPALLFIGAVLVSTVLGGGGPGLVATGAATAAIALLYPPDGNDEIWDVRRVAVIATFVVEALLVVAVTVASRRAGSQLRAESRRQSALAQLTARALTTRDDAQIFKAATDAVVADLPAEASMVLAGGRGTTEVVAFSGQGSPLADPEIAGLLQLRAGSAFETTAENGPYGPFLRRHGLSSMVAAPLGMHDDRSSRVLVGFRKSRRALRASQLRFIDTVAAMITAASQRRASEAALERSEERLRVAQGAAGIGTWEWDLQTQRMTWADGLEQLHGLAPGDFPRTADAYIELVHPDDRDQLTRAAREALGGGRFDVSYRVITAGGGARWIAAKGQVYVDDNGRATRAVGVGLDLTEQIQYEDQIRVSEERFRTMANAAPVLLRVAAPDGRCVFVNERWTELTAHPVAEHMGFGWLEFVHPDDRDECSRRLLASVDSQAADEWEYRVCSASGEERWMLDRNVPVVAGDGTLIGFVGSCTDLTERRNAEDARRFAAESAAELASSLDYEDTLDRFANLAVPLFADWCVIFKREPTGGVRRISVVHRDPARAEAAQRLLQLDPLNPGGDSIAATAIREGTPILIKDVAPEQVEQIAAHEVDRSLLQALDIRSLIAVPMTIQTSTIGAILFIRGDSGRRFTDDDLTLAVDLGRRASISIENARLYTELREREAALERANEMLTFLLDASAELSRTLDFKEMMTALASRATPRVADWCVILTLDEEAMPLVLAASHGDPAWGDRVRRLQESYPFNPAPGTPIMRALQERHPAFLPEIPEYLIAAAARDPHHLELINELGLRSAIIVPIVGARETYGAMVFVMSHSGRHYTEEDFSTLQDLVHRAAVAFDNARLFHEATVREQELMRANEAKDEFMGMMSHELRTPLTVINGGARILRSRSGELDNQTKDEILGDIEGESERLFRMVENLLSLAHLEFTEPFDVEPVHAGHVSEKIIAAFHARRPDRQVDLRVEPGAETFAAQPVYFEQVVRNLLSNADKYSPRGTTIEVVVGRGGEGIGEFRVLDRGVGIDPDEAEAIFERFYRSERTARLVGGSGVGLALCKRLVEAMSGHIWARPREGGGLEVGFSLPLYEEAFV